MGAIRLSAGVIAVGSAVSLGRRTDTSRAEYQDYASPNQGESPMTLSHKQECSDRLYTPSVQANGSAFHGFECSANLYVKGFA